MGGSRAFSGGHPQGREQYSTRREVRGPSDEDLGLDIEVSGVREGGGASYLNGHNYHEPTVLKVLDRDSGSRVGHHRNR